MGLILIGIVFVVGAFFIARRCDKKDGFLMWVSEPFLVLLGILGVTALVMIGLTGGCTGESEYTLTETIELVGVNKGESTYIFLDEENQGYYLNDNKMVVVKKYGENTTIHCTKVIGDYDKIYLEKYEIDYKMNFWTFNIMDGVEYKIYIPQSMVSK